MSDIEQMLRDAAGSIEWELSSIALISAADEIERLRAENERLRAALKPFADALKDNYYHQVDELPIIAGSNQMDIRFKWALGDLRAAAAAIRESGE